MAGHRDLQGVVVRVLVIRKLLLNAVELGILAQSLRHGLSGVESGVRNVLRMGADRIVQSVSHRKQMGRQAVQFAPYARASPEPCTLVSDVGYFQNRI